MSEGRRTDVHTYMNRFVLHRPMAADFGLTRDLSRWGLEAGEADLLVYSLRPVWVPKA